MITFSARAVAKLPVRFASSSQNAMVGSHLEVEAPTHNWRDYNVAAKAYAAPLLFAARKKTTNDYPPDLSAEDREFLNQLDADSRQLHRDGSRMDYAFRGAYITDEYDINKILGHYPRLSSVSTVRRLKKLYWQHPDALLIQRMFFDVSRNCLFLQTADARKKYEEATRKLNQGALSNAEQLQRMQELMTDEERVVKQMGFKSLYAFLTGDPEMETPRLAQAMTGILDATDSIYQKTCFQLYQNLFDDEEDNPVRRFSDIHPSSISSLIFRWADNNVLEGSVWKNLSGKPAMTLVRKTFDGLGFNFSRRSQVVHFEDMDAYQRFLERAHGPKRIFIDETPGDYSAAVFYPQYPFENYLSINGELSPFSSVGLHEGAHAVHHSMTPATKPYVRAAGGQNAVSEGYGILFEVLYQNQHWLSNIAGVDKAQAKIISRQKTLEMLYLFRLNAIILGFDMSLYDGTPLKGKPERYQAECRRRLGMSDWADTWNAHHNPDIYSQYHTMGIILHAQLEEYLRTHFGTSEQEGDDWYANKAAGQFLKGLFREGKLSPQELSQRLGYNDPLDVQPFLRQVQRRLAD